VSTEATLPVHAASLAALLASAALPAAQPADAPGSRAWHFQVSLDGRPIGWHDFTLAGTAQQGEFASHARLRVTAFRIPVYSYEHQDEESWRGGCLDRIDARTSETGHEYIVHGQQVEDAFDVHGPQGPAALQGCVRSFAYWNPAILEATRLLNAQTGAYEAVRVSRLADGPVRWRGRDVTGRHYQISTPGFRLELWYSAAGDWLALRSHTRDGRVLDYEIPP